MGASLCLGRQASSPAQRVKEEASPSVEGREGLRNKSPEHRPTEPAQVGPRLQPASQSLEMCMQMCMVRVAKGMGKTKQCQLGLCMHNGGSAVVLTPTL